MTNKEIYEYYYQEHVNDKGNKDFHDAYALQYLVEHCLKNKFYKHLSEVEYDKYNTPLVDEYEIICSTYNDPIFGFMRIEDGENVLVYSTSEGLQYINL